jgi:hypothetical protein
VTVALPQKHRLVSLASDSLLWESEGTGRKNSPVTFLSFSTSTLVLVGRAKPIGFRGTIMLSANSICENLTADELFEVNGGGATVSMVIGMYNNAVGAEPGDWLHIDAQTVNNNVGGFTATAGAFLYESKDAVENAAYQTATFLNDLPGNIYTTVAGWFE